MRLYHVSLTTSCNPLLCASSSTKAWLASLCIVVMVETVHVYSGNGRDSTCV